MKEANHGDRHRMRVLVLHFVAIIIFIIIIYFSTFLGCHIHPSGCDPVMSSAHP